MKKLFNSNRWYKDSITKEKQNSSSSLRGFHADKIFLDVPICEYFISVDSLGSDKGDYYSYCLVKRDKNNDEIILLNTTKDEDQFTRDVEDLERLFNIKAIKQLP